MNASRPFFVVGAPRSGTTLLRLMLNEHPRLAVPPESHFIRSLHRKFDHVPDSDEFLAALGSEQRFLEWDLPIDVVRRRAIGATGWRALFEAVFASFAATKGKTRWGDKTPEYAKCIPLIAEVFPDLQVIQIVRDGRDVVCSLLDVDWADGDAGSFINTWARSVRAAREGGRDLAPDAYLEVRYEDLVESPGTVLRSICAFLGEDYTERMLDYSRSVEHELPAHRRAWHRRLERPPETNRVERWRRDLSPTQVAEVQWRAGRTLREFGYPLELSPRVAAGTVSWAIQRGLIAMRANGRRSARPSGRER